MSAHATPISPPEATSDQISAAEGYDRLLVPALMADWPSVLLETADLQSGESLLDVGCGTGVLAREALQRVGESGEVTGLDIGPGMIAVAQRLTPQARWHVGPAEDMPFTDASFDVVASQFGFMFFSEPKAAAEICRVLRPGGRAVAAVWDALDRNPGYAAEVRLLEHEAGTDAADAVRIPFRLGSPDRMVSTLEGAGLDDVDVETHSGWARFPSVRAMVEADLRGWLPVMGVHLSDAQIEHILAEAEATLADYVQGDGRVVFPVSAHVTRGVKAG